MSTAHQALVSEQFSPRARAYVDSADHAFGEDLERLKRLVAADPHRRVLDLGCGGGHVSFAVAPHAAEVVAYDLSQEMLSAVRHVAGERGLTNIRTQDGVAEALPFPDASFDFVFTRFSAHHWYDLPTALAGMRRVLKPGGTAVVMDIVSPDAAALHDTFLQTVEILRDPSHVRDYRVAEWIDLLRAAGFRPVAPILSKLKLDFTRWVERIGTPRSQIEVIRALQARMPAEIVEHFAIQPDGSFELDTMFLKADT